MNAVQLIRILQFADSVLPVGAFAFSNGVESAIQAGIVRDADTLQSFTRTALQQAAGGDGRAVTAACRALQAGDREVAMGHDWALFNRKLNEEGRNMVVRMGKSWRKWRRPSATNLRWSGGLSRSKPAAPPAPIR